MGEYKNAETYYQKAYELSDNDDYKRMAREMD
jgi:hypothetical protein